MKNRTTEVKIREQCRSCNGKGEIDYVVPLMCHSCQGTGRCEYWIELQELASMLGVKK
jgi:DnaJ-class molecular chaperone